MIKNNAKIAAVILTYNEELHIERCINSLHDVCDDIIVVDSFSTDRTKEICFSYGVRYFENNFVNHATQLNWALLNTEIQTDWILRIDADEFLDDSLRSSLSFAMENSGLETIGFRINRLMYFLGGPLRRGGMHPMLHLRVWRRNMAVCEQRWMDEHMVMISEGEIGVLKGNLIDWNLNNITWWTNKHNNYATREAIDILISRFQILEGLDVKPHLFGSTEQRRRWLKYRYLKMPLFVRPFCFFLYRYLFLGGFLEGRRGLIWTILQCLWYRFLVDVKLLEIKIACGNNVYRINQFIKENYGYEIKLKGHSTKE